MNSELSKPRRGRPKKQVNAEQDTRAALIRSGLELLTEKGYFASGIDLILKQVKVPKGSFYHYFASKEAFGHAVLESYDSYFAYKLDTYLFDQAYPPLTRLSNFVESAKQGIEKYQFKRGCLVGNLGQEVELLPESFRQQIVDIFLSWQQRLARCFKLAQQQGQIAGDADCDYLAECFWVGWEGAVSRARLVESLTPLDNFYHHFLAGLPK